MKASAILFGLVVINFFSYSQFNIKGTIENATANSYLYLYKIKTAKLVELIDSTRLKGDSSFAFSISNYVEGDLFMLVGSREEGLNEFPNSSFLFCTDASNSIAIRANSINDLYKSEVIIGSEQNKIISKNLLHNLKAYFDILSRIVQEPSATDSLFLKIFQFQTTYRDSVKSLITQATMSNVLITAFYFLNKLDDGSINGRFSSYYNSFNSQLPATTLTNDLKNIAANHAHLINIEEILKIPVYSLKDTTRRNIASLLKTEYVLLDLWASWCGPCRVANKFELPKLIMQYKSNDNFSVIALSIDVDKKKWTKAVIEDKITWDSYTTVNDYNNQPIPQFLKGNGVPYYILMSKDGKYLNSTSSIALINDWIKKL